MTRRERLENKVAKRAEWAAKADARSDARLDAAQRLASVIPLGQPILVGHHSERRHRRDLERIDGNMRKGIEESKLAEHHRSAGSGLADQLERSVFSDDTDAVQQLEARISEHEAQRDRMKLVNKLWAKKDAAGLAAIGLDLARLTAKLAEAGAYWGSKPHLPYELTNLGARIRADRERLEEVKRRQERTAKAEGSAGGVVIEGGDWVRVTFADKPAREILDALRGAGFCWRGGSWIGERAKLPAVVTAERSEDAS